MTIPSIEQQRTRAQRAADTFNRQHPAGTAVRYWPGLRSAEGRLSTIRGRAWGLPSGDAVVRVAGHSGGIALTHIEVVEAI